jgi:hypothetical protein
MTGGRTQQRPGLYQLRRDPATDRSNLNDLETVGLAFLDPATGLLVASPAAVTENLGGRQVGVVAAFTPAGRAGLRVTQVFRALGRGRSNYAGLTPVLAPGTIRRDVTYPLVGGGGAGPFSKTANTRPGGPGIAFQPSNTTDYLVSSMHLQLPRALRWVVAGVKPLIGEGPDASHRHNMLGRASGRPVIAAQVPSFSSQIPLLRPRNLVSNN